ncbi:MAG TPA: heme-binding beta-barrel domain-containing protein [Acidimicrobiales bacterium]|nr:heme-binding beta-barrel domain-containing protein [Acidimicrobiales bacterium]
MTAPELFTAEAYGPDIYTEAPGASDTLANLGPLRPLAGVWEGRKGIDDHPVAEGTEIDAFVEHYELQPIDRQTNGPQLFYGLRYHTHLVKPGEVETFHDQVGYWLWEPAASSVLFTLAIPRGQVLLAGGRAEADATEFEVSAALGGEFYGIASNPFLDRAFRTTSFRMTVTVNGDGTWSYDEEAMLLIPDRSEPYRHTDRNTLTRVGLPSPNPLALVGTATAGASLGIGDLRKEMGNLS